MNETSNGLTVKEAEKIVEKQIRKGSTVKFNDGSGYFVVTAYFSKSQTVNLGRVWSGTVVYKSVPINKLTEAYDEWYAAWQKSEAYQSM